MKKLLDMLSKHKKLMIVLSIVLLLVIICLVIRAINLSKKPTDILPDDFGNIIVSDGEQESESEKLKDPSYDSNLGLGTDKDDGTVEVEKDTETEDEEQTTVPDTPSYQTIVSIWDYTAVPIKTMDGRSFKGYLEKVKLSDFGTYWGSKLTDDDFNSNKLYLVGAKQDEKDQIKGDLQSVGWLIQNLSTLKPNDAIKFTNLHVIGSLSNNHVALLCCYDWYSAFGLDDTLVVFEDISNTLKVNDFKDGDIFSATVFVHNVKVVDNVKGQRVVVVQYDVF